MIKYYTRPARRHEQAHQAWMIIVGWVSLKNVGANERPGIITYGELADMMGYPFEAGVTLGKPLGAIGRLCQDAALPLLNVVVVNAENGKPGHQVVREDRSIIDQQQDVLDFDWFSVRQPSMKSFQKYQNPA